MENEVPQTSKKFRITVIQKGITVCEKFADRITDFSIVGGGSDLMKIDAIENNKKLYIMTSDTLMVEEI